MKSHLNRIELVTSCDDLKGELEEEDEVEDSLACSKSEGDKVWVVVTIIVTSFGLLTVTIGTLVLVASVKQATRVLRKHESLMPVRNFDQMACLRTKGERIYQDYFGDFFSEGYSEVYFPSGDYFEDYFFRK